MSWREFIASVVGSLAWPLLLLAILLILRGRISEVLNGLRFDHTKRVSVGTTGIDMEFFDHQIEDVRVALTEGGDRVEVEPNPGSIAAASAQPQATIDRLLEVSPRAAVIESYVRLEVALRGMATRAGNTDAEEQPIRSVLGWLHREALIGTSTYEAALGLTRTRNEVAHGADEIDKPRALQFLSLATEVQSRLQSIKLDDD